MEGAGFVVHWPGLTESWNDGVMLDSRSLPELSWEDSCALWQAAGQMVGAWMGEVAKDEAGPGVTYRDLNLLSLFDFHLTTEFAYPALTTCARLDQALSSGRRQIVLWDDNSVSSRTIRAYAQAGGIPLVVRPCRPKMWVLRDWAEGLEGAHRVRRFFFEARMRWQNRTVEEVIAGDLTILALLGAGIYVTSALPVLDSLRHKSRIMIIPLDFGVDRLLARQGWPGIIASERIPASRRPGVRRSQRDLRRTGQRLVHRPDLLRAFCTRQLDLSSVARPLIETLLKVRIPMALPAIEGLAAIIQSDQPQVIFSVPDRWWFARAAIELGRQAGIPSLTMQAAVINSHPRYDTIVADRIAVMGDISRRLWMEQGIAAEKLVVTGAPRFDNRYQTNPDAPRIVRSDLGIPSDKPIITFATQPLSRDVIERNARHFIQAVDRFPEYQVVFKVHPREDARYYKALLAELGAKNVIITQDIGVELLLQASDLLVTGFSTVALEAMLFERPVLIVNLTGEPDPVDYVESGAALGAYAPEEITRQMDRFLTDPLTNASLAEARRRYVTNQLYKVDGLAARRVAALIQEMAARVSLTREDRETV